MIDPIEYMIDGLDIEDELREEMISLKPTELSIYTDPLEFPPVDPSYPRFVFRIRSDAFFKVQWDNEGRIDYRIWHYGLHRDKVWSDWRSALAYIKERLRD